jgi:hypothetical protein
VKIKVVYLMDERTKEIILSLEPLKRLMFIFYKQKKGNVVKYIGAVAITIKMFGCQNSII